MSNEALAKRILDVLDECADDFRFPMPDNAYVYYGDMRLTVFRSDEEWLIAFTELTYFCKLHEFECCIYAYGNKLEKCGLQPQSPALNTGVFDEAPGHPICDEEGRFALDPFHFHLAVNGRVREFQLTAEDYRSAGVDVHSGAPVEAQILRYLVFRLQDKVFISDEKILEICGRQNAGLKRFLPLDDWLHPNLADNELPGVMESFESLAHAIAINDPAAYDDTIPGNTHWTNWPSLEEQELHRDKQHEPESKCTVDASSHRRPSDRGLPLARRSETTRPVE